MPMDPRNNREINRLNAMISSEEQTINAFFQQIGQTYFANHRNDPEENQKQSIRGILDALDRAKGYKDQINVLRGIAICPNCHKEVAIESAFCNFCGTKMPAAKAPEPVVDPNTIICQNCGNRCLNTQRFCNRCGTKLAAPAPAQPQPAPVPPAPPAPPAPEMQPPEPQPVPAAAVQSPVYAAPPTPPPAPVMPEPPVEQPEVQMPAPEPEPEPAAPQKKICPNCGTEMDPDCNFCLECGTRL